jgi:hypothetical protein
MKTNYFFLKLLAKFGIQSLGRGDGREFSLRMRI